MKKIAYLCRAEQPLGSAIFSIRTPIQIRTFFVFCFYLRNGGHQKQLKRIPLYINYPAFLKS